MKKTKNLIQKTLHRIKKEMKTNTINRTSIVFKDLSVDRNIININTVRQDSSLIKTINVETTLFNEKQNRNNVTISCQLFSQMISIKRISKRD
jgi:hypothetical protein